MDAAQTRTVSTTAGWVALDSLPCTRVSILNTTGADLQIRKTAETAAGQQITIPDDANVTLTVKANASEIQIKGAGVATGVELVFE